MTPLDYDYLRRCLKDRSGLLLSADKQYLVESRLLPVARKAGVTTLGELVSKLRGAHDPALMTGVVEAMTTNETFFFRDKVPFEHFRATIMPALLEARRAARTIRIWCAAASTGQEPCSLAMYLKEIERDILGWRIEMLATDLSGEVLEKARAGIYSQFEVQRGLPVQMLMRYFRKEETGWRISEAIRGMVQFREWNLLGDLRGLGQFDVVFCRNVLIYFDQPTKARVLDAVAQQMPGDGLLYLGGAETVLGITTRFAPLASERGVYGLTA